MPSGPRLSNYQQRLSEIPGSMSRFKIFSALISVGYQCFPAYFGSFNLKGVELLQEVQYDMALEVCSREWACIEAPAGCLVLWGQNI